jgi:hypothetical protein
LFIKQDFPFLGNPIRHNAVEGRDPVGGDNEQRIAQIEDFPDFAALQLAKAWKIQIEQSCFRHIAARMADGEKKQSVKCSPPLPTRSTSC